MVPFTPGEEPAALAERFHAEHERRYGHSTPGAAVELVTLRASVVRPGPPVALAPPRMGAGTPSARRGIRVAGDTLVAAVYAEDALAPGFELEQPAIVEYAETTCLVPPGWSAHVDRHGLLRLEAT